MSFYQELSRYYDEVFPVDISDMQWLSERLTGRLRILDLGCGTGNKTEYLAAPGREIFGLDLDKDMIDIAETEHFKPGVKYLVGDITKASDYFLPKYFDGLICLGNTLPHILDRGLLASFLRSISGLMSSGGTAFFQILNYDTIIAERRRELPLIETDHIVFRRYYDWSGASLSFRTVLEVKGEGGPRYDNSVPLRPILQNELIDLLSAAFGTMPVLYGGFQGEPFREDSFVLMAEVRRN